MYKSIQAPQLLTTLQEILHPFLGQIEKLVLFIGPSRGPPHALILGPIMPLAGGQKDAQTQHLGPKFTQAAN